MKGYYSDNWSEFECLILACSVNGNNYLIQDLESDDIGWCSCHLVDDNL